MTYKALILVAMILFVTGCAFVPGQESREQKAKKIAEKYCSSDNQGRKAILDKVNNILSGEVRIDCLSDGAVLHYVRRI